jgi:hypothetical protein
MDERFSYGTERGEEPPEDAGAGQGNRVFTIFAIGLVGLIFIGLLGIGFYFLRIKPQRDREQIARITQVVAEQTEIARETALAPTSTPLPTSTPVPTDTPLPTPTPKATNTLVVATPPTLPPGAVPTPTRTPVGGPQTPPTGIGGLGAVLAAVGLIAVILVARKLRLAT